MSKTLILSKRPTQQVSVMYSNKLRIIFKISRVCYSYLKVTPKCSINYSKSNLGISKARFHPSKCNFSKYAEQTSYSPAGLSTSNELVLSIEANYKDFRNVPYDKLLKLLDVFQEEPSLACEMKDDQILLLLNACSDLMPTKSPEIRMHLFNKLWEILKQSYKLKTNHYLAALDVYRQNGKSVDEFIDFLSEEQINYDKWTIEMYENIIYFACEKGNVQKATELISKLMEKDTPLTTNVYNSLILGHCRNKDLASVHSTVDTMKSNGIQMTSSTYTELIRAFIEMNQNENAINLLMEHSGEFQPNQILTLIKSAINSNNYICLPSLINELPNSIPISYDVPILFRNFCFELIFQRRYKELFTLIEVLPPPHFNSDQDTDTYAVFIIKQLLRTDSPYDEIVKICEYLVKSEKNTRALHIASEIALRQTPDLIKPYFDSLSQFEQLRPHYFWPLFVQNFNKYGEVGILETIKQMISYKIDCDNDTIKKFILPKLFTTLQDPKQAIKILIDCGLKSSQILTPIISQLIFQKKMTEVCKLAKLYEHKFNLAEFVPHLDTLAVHVSCGGDRKLFQQFARMLQILSTKAKDPNVDFAGHALIAIAENETLHNDLCDFIQEIYKVGLQISPAAKEALSIYVGRNKNNPKMNLILKNLSQMCNTNLGFANELLQGAPGYTHPKDMTLQELECHLVELENKGLNSRGVLRKILQMYVRIGNLEKALETKKKCDKLKVNLSPGMLASILDMNIKLKDLENAEMALKDLQKLFPTFLIDEHKIIDYASLLVENDQLDKAKNILTERVKSNKVIGGENIVKNVWNLLTNVANLASKDKNMPREINKTKELFNLLCQMRLCSPQNTLFGPIIREYLLRNNIVAAVEEFKQIANNHNHTPLQYELLSLLVALSNGNNLDKYQVTSDQAKSLLDDVIATISKIHGTTNMNSSLLLAVAESGTEKQVRKLLINPEFRVNQEMLIKNCDHLSEEGSIVTLTKLAKASRNLNHIIDEQNIYNELLRNFITKNKYEAALELFQRLEADDEFQLSQEFSRKLANLLKMNNLDVPSNVALHAQVM